MQEHSTIPLGFCQCGCGQRTKIAPRNRHDIGWRKGEPILYVNGHTWRTRRKNGRIPTAPEQRFWSKVDKDGPVPSHQPELGQCWIWTGSRTHFGHGKFGMSAQGRGSIPASVFAWEYTFGPIPTGQFPCHRCDNPPCVRPGHLFLGTRLDNIADMISKERGWWQEHGHGRKPFKCWRLSP